MSVGGADAFDGLHDGPDGLFVQLDHPAAVVAASLVAEGDFAARGVFEANLRHGLWLSAPRRGRRRRLLLLGYFPTRTNKKCARTKLHT